MSGSNLTGQTNEVEQQPVSQPGFMRRAFSAIISTPGFILGRFVDGVKGFASLAKKAGLGLLNLVSSVVKAPFLFIGRRFGSGSSQANTTAVAAEVTPQQSAPAAATVANPSFLRRMWNRMAPISFLRSFFTPAAVQPVVAPVQSQDLASAQPQEVTPPVAEQAPQEVVAPPVVEQAPQEVVTPPVVEQAPQEVVTPPAVEQNVAPQQPQEVVTPVAEQAPQEVAPPAAAHNTHMSALLKQLKNHSPLSWSYNKSSNAAKFTERTGDAVNPDQTQKPKSRFSKKLGNQG